MVKRSGAEVLAEMLQGYGVTHVFMVPSVLRRTLAEMERRTAIRRIQVHAEKSAAYMADGYARACGRPGICMAQVVGALNLAAGLRDAHLANAPVIAMTGGRDPHTKFRKAYQDLDDLPSFEPVTKFNATVDEVARHPRSGAPGLPGRRVGQARPGAPAVPGQRGADRLRGSGNGAAGGRAVRASAALQAGAHAGTRSRRARCD